MKTRLLFKGFLEDCARRNQKSNTIISHESNIRFTIGPLIGDIGFKSLRPVDMSELIENGHERGVTTARSVIKTMRCIFKYAKSCRIPLPFEVSELILPREGRLRDLEVLTADDIFKIRYALDSKNIKYSKHYSFEKHDRHRLAVIRARCLFELLLHSGLRISEALSIKKEDVNFETGEIRVRNAKREIGAEEWGSVYIFGSEKYILDYVAYRKDTDPYLFVTYEGKKLSERSAHSALRCLKKQIGLKKNLNHRIFRSTFVTLLLEGGLDPKEAQRLARHKNLWTTLKYYYRVDDAKLKPKHKAIMEKV